MEEIGPEAGTQFLQAVYQKGDKTNVLYVSDHGEGKRNSFGRPPSNLLNPTKRRK
ncbi:MAG: hypothetical protein IPP42_05285 [Saprospiraceae bacterium]|nr:hypothetical protein [Saprospiraceae bacterium]